MMSIDRDERTFYSNLGLATGLGAMLGGYLTLFNIGLGLLLLAAASALVAIALRPTLLRTTFGAAVLLFAALPLVTVIANVT
jgi:hypothetical protein